MGDQQTQALAAALLFFMVGGAVVVLIPWFRRRPPRPATPANPEKGVVQETCRSCQRPMVFHRNSLHPISPVEKGLAVSAKPALRGKELALQVCPYCDAAHYFILERNGEFTFAGMNFYEPQEKSSRCMSCGKALKTPPWPELAYDGRVMEASRGPDMGLICSRCHAVSCVACCENSTRGSAEAEGYVCPRCGRRPVDRFFHF